MKRPATLFRMIGRTLFRMEFTFVLLLLGMTAIGRFGDLDARIKLVLVDAIQLYRAESIITAMDNDNSSAISRRRATAAMPRER